MPGLDAAAANTIHLDPSPDAWRLRDPEGSIDGVDLSELRRATRAALGVDPDRRLIVSGHQPVMWGPGIVAKYAAAHACAARHDADVRHVIVDHVPVDFHQLTAPVLDDTRGVRARTLIYAPAPTPAVPAELHETFDPVRPEALAAPFDFIETGVDRWLDALADARNAPNAAQQVWRATEACLRDHLPRTEAIAGSTLLETPVGAALLRAMASDPRACAEAYNAAARSVPAAGIPRLLIRDDYVELPVWRLRDDGRRMRAYDNDVEAALAGDGPRLRPRALLLTALLRLACADLFIHGTGGGGYEAVGDAWLRAWLGVRGVGYVVASADVRLPLLEAVEGIADAPPRDQAIVAWRDARHDPPRHDAGMSDTKRAHVEAIDALPRGSAERARAFREMQAWLDDARNAERERLATLAAQRRAAEQRALIEPLARRRDWPFVIAAPGALEAMHRSIAAAFS